MIAISGGVEGSGWLTFSTPFLDPGCSKQAWRSSDKQDSVALAVLMRAEAARPARIIYTANLNLSVKVLGYCTVGEPYPTAAFRSRGTLRPAF